MLKMYPIYIKTKGFQNNLIYQIIYFYVLKLDKIMHERTLPLGGLAHVLPPFMGSPVFFHIFILYKDHKYCNVYFFHYPAVLNNAIDVHVLKMGDVLWVMFYKF